ncbi:MAG: recombinase family protein [Anaerolineales bacterium]|nr:recombinase family protein [Anaerolineales bacterium]
MNQPQSGSETLQFVVIERVVLYARVSGDDRGRDGRNLQSQLDMGREYAQGKGYSIIAELAEDDRGASGADINLPKLNQVRDMALKGQFDVLIVREIDRLSRNLAKQLIVEEELRKAGVRVEYVLADYQDSPEGRLNKHIRATIAEYEREKIRERMVRGRENKAKAGKVIACDRIPYGYRLNDERTNFVICPDEAEIVKMIFESFTIERTSIRKIAAKLTKLKIPTAADKHERIRKKRGFGEWSFNTISKILYKRTYTGKWEYNKDSDSGEIQVKVPAIIDQLTFDLAQARLAGNKKYYRRETIHDFLLNKRCRCGICGSKMSALPANKGKYLYYRCPSLDNNRPIKCQVSKMFNARKVDAVVWAWIRSLLQDEKAVTEVLRSAQNRQDEIAAPFIRQLETIDTLIADNEKKQAKLLDLYLSDDFPRDVLDDRKKQIKDTLASLEQERAKVQAKINEIRPLTDEAIANIQEFTLKVGRGLAEADKDLQLRREAVEALSVEVTLTEEDGQQVIIANCVLTQENENLGIVPDILLSGVVWYAWGVLQIITILSFGGLTP